MKYFVYYQDNYYEMGGVGFEEFSTEDDALAFIEKRLRTEQDVESEYYEGLDAYMLIHGSKLPLKPVKYVTRIAVNREESYED